MGKQSIFFKIFSGSFLVAGTAIGAGMLALPLSTAQAGFFPAAIVYACCWVFSIATGLLMMEITMNVSSHSNLISMSSAYLGKAGKIASWILYLFQFYCLTIAYIAGGASLISNLIFSGSNYGISMSLFVVLFGFCVLMGPKIVNKMNLSMMFGLIIAYFGFIFFGLDQWKETFIARVEFPYVIAALPVVFTSFSYQGILPTLTDYLNRDRKAIRLSIIIGATIPFVAYTIWDFLIKGIVPMNDLLLAKDQGLSAIEPLKKILENSPIAILGQFFAFFALTTSFLGVTLGLLDFLSDGLKVEKKGFKRALLCLLIYLPSSLIAITNPNIFFKALNYAGGIGCALLLGLIPVLMVFVKRYVKKEKRGHIELFGGKTLLMILVVFIFYVVGVTLT